MRKTSVPYKVNKHSRFGTELEITLRAEDFAEWEKAYTDYVLANREMIIELTAGTDSWLLVLKSAVGSARGLLAHPNDTEWAATVTLGSNAIQCLKNTISNGGTFTHDQEDRLDRTSNLHFVLRRP